MASSFLSLALCTFLVLLSGRTLGQFEQQRPFHTGTTQRFRGRTECRLENLNPSEPSRRIEAEAGFTEYWDENSEPFECAGIAAARHIIQQRGLLQLSFSNAPRIVYIVQGRGMTGEIIPGCPESYQTVQYPQQEERGQRYRDEHQKIRAFRAGDTLVIPAGVSHWCFNDGEETVVMVEVLDTGNAANQLDQNARTFYLAGNVRHQQPGSYEQERAGQEKSGVTMIAGFDEAVLAAAMGVSRETVRKLQGRDDERGHIIQVREELQGIRPWGRQAEEEERREREQGRDNGLEDTICTMRLRENIGDPEKADLFSPQAGRLTKVNSQKLPILNTVRMSAERGHLVRDAILALHWNTNAHAAVYVIRGEGQFQVVGDTGRSVYDGRLRRGQLLIIPQNYAVVTQAGEQGLDWVSFKTNDNAMMSPLVGKASVYAGIPEAVLMNSYRIQREEARQLKQNRYPELTLHSPHYQSQRRD
ncbi:hypothetical protein H6P81_011795 [Aristolochia fimbriata]|uniref:Cupin type-1 domain-containing protein n=1 Tax=Aristolochia fimbriata TaxID=158543 RepID=A0AAV7ED83_ARIFI|nr:hypothetical protein H6P81_011795 [Aristolochia fimbriata]